MLRESQSSHGEQSRNANGAGSSGVGVQNNARMREGSTVSDAL
jgi:hypothetical protein